MAERARRTARSVKKSGVTAFLIDEMFPMAAAEPPRTMYGDDAVHVAEAGLRAAADGKRRRPDGPKAGPPLPGMSRISPPNAT